MMIRKLRSLMMVSPNFRSVIQFHVGRPRRENDVTVIATVREGEERWLEIIPADGRRQNARNCRPDAIDRRS